MEYLGKDAGLLHKMENLVKAHYSNNTTKGPGYGFLLISEAPDSVDPQGVLFCIKRASDHQYLAHSGWQATETLNAPQEVLCAEGVLTLSIDPAIVDNLDVRETYRLILAHADGTRVSGSLSVAEVAYSPQPEGRFIASSFLVEPPAVAKAQPDTDIQLSPKAEPASAPIPLPEPPIVAQPPRPQALWFILASLITVVLLAGGGFAVWKFLFEESASPIAEDAASPAVSPLTQVRELLTKGASPEESVRLAGELRVLPDSADAAFLLYEDAAQKGHAEAMLLAGSFYDPTASEPSGTIKKDASEALAWYKKAEASGLPAAKELLARLRAWAEGEATKGSAEAQNLLKAF